MEVSLELRQDLLHLRAAAVPSGPQFSNLELLLRVAISLELKLSQWELLPRVAISLEHQLSNLKLMATTPVSSELLLRIILTRLCRCNTG